MKRQFLMITAVLLVILSVPATVSAFDIFHGASGTCTNGGGASSAICQDSSNTSDPAAGRNGLIRTIANVIAVIAGLAAVIVIIMAGLQYITAGGDAAKAKEARSTIIYAAIGLIVIALSASILGYVLSNL